MSAAALAIRPLTRSRWKDFERLFGTNGACGGCWCMFFHQSGPEYAARKGAKNRRAMRKRVDSGVVPGLIGYLDGEPVAWVAIEPRDRYERITRSRKLLAAARGPVWSTPCFFVKRGFRAQGLTLAMLQAATAYARRKGAALVEGYPVDPGARTAAAFAFPGIASTFVKAGFTEAARTSRTRPVMRCAVGAKSAR